jgi:hypothetical protein
MTTPPTDGSTRIGGPAPDHSGADSTTTTRTTERRAEPVPHRGDPTLIRPTPATGTQPGVETRPARPAKTSAAAAFALVFGLSALICALTALLSPVAIVLGLIGIVLGIVGMKMAKRPGVTGKGVAIGGLVTALLGLVLGGVVLGGLTAVINNESQLDRIQGYLDKARAQLPTTDEVRQQIPGQ